MLRTLARRSQLLPCVEREFLDLRLISTAALARRLRVVFDKETVLNGFPQLVITQKSPC